MTRREVEMFLMQIAREREMLHWALEDGAGEVTEDVAAQEEKINQLVEIFKSEGGIDAVGRFVKYGQDKISARKAEKEYAERHLKAEEKEQANFLALINKALKKANLENAKGHYGYSFTQHVSCTTKVDNKKIKELYYTKVDKVLQDSGILPKDITFSLSASVTKLEEGDDLPEWYNVAEIDKATFRKPTKAKEGDEEFQYNELQ